MLAADIALADAAPWWQPRPPSRLLVTGGQPLRGDYRISGAKNAVLPLMVAALLSPNRLLLRNAPTSLDVAVLAALLQRLGAKLDWQHNEDGLAVGITAADIHAARIDRELVARMRASVLLLSVLLVRCGEADLPLPGGDAIGRRGIDFHLNGLRAMGAEIDIVDNAIRARAPNGLHGTDFALPFPSVGATENLMLAAFGASGTTRLGNVAREPEIDDLARCLSAMGAQIDGIGTGTLTISGNATPAAATHFVLPDRIELGTLACAAALTDGDLHLLGGRLDLLAGAGEALQRAGVVLTPTARGLRARRAPEGLVATDIRTEPFPGFATDLQAPTMALLCLARGSSVLEETIFEQRFRHVAFLQAMGGDIVIDGSRAMISGVDALHGAAVTGTDVRAAAALVIAALSAEGSSEIDGIDHLDRGYDRLEDKLKSCGAHIHRTETS